MDSPHVKFPLLTDTRHSVTWPGREFPAWDVIEVQQRVPGRDAVALVLSTGIGFAQARRDLWVNAETLRNWVKQAKIDLGQGRWGR
jgi:hypothetical protein